MADGIQGQRGNVLGSVNDGLGHMGAGRSTGTGPRGTNNNFGAGSSGGGSAEDLYGRSPDTPSRYRPAPARQNTVERREVDVTMPLVFGIGAGFLFGYLFGRPGQSDHSPYPQYRETRHRAERQPDSRSYRASSSRSVETDETGDLIASDKVEGTAVYNRQGEKLGSVHNFMVGKRSGRVAYAVLSFGGLLGMGQSFHALPWNALTYDTNRGGYVVDLDKDRLSRAPSHQAGEDPFSDAGYRRRVTDYWSGPVI